MTTITLTITQPKIPWIIIFASSDSGNVDVNATANVNGHSKAVAAHLASCHVFAVIAVGPGSVIDPVDVVKFRVQNQNFVR